MNNLKCLVKITMFILPVYGILCQKHGYYRQPPPSHGKNPSIDGTLEQGSRHPGQADVFQEDRSWQFQWNRRDWVTPHGDLQELSPGVENVSTSKNIKKPEPIEAIDYASQAPRPETILKHSGAVNMLNRNNSTTRPPHTKQPTRRPPTTRRTPPPAYRPAAGPEPGTMSRPVPSLGRLFAPSLQWHAGIYTKTFTPYMQVCGGSVVKNHVVLSAAHCFWNDVVGALRPGLFAVAAGKLLRPWQTEGEIYTQHSDIKDIMIPPRFQGGKTSFQDDIAIVFLSRSLEHAPGVKPICVSFDLGLERSLLTSGNLGKIAGWGLTTPNGPPSQRLNFLELPYVDIQECIRTADSSFLKYITSDKICAGDQKTGRALCRGDSGGGLAYYAGDTPYLFGVASTAPRDSNECNAYAVATFTHVQAHRMFLEEHVPGIGKGCEELYEDKTSPVQNGTITSRQSMTDTMNGPSLADKDENVQTTEDHEIPNAITERSSDVTGYANGRNPKIGPGNATLRGQVTHWDANVTSGEQVTNRPAWEVTSGEQVTNRPTWDVTSGEQVTKRSTWEVTSGEQVTKRPTWEVASGEQVTNRPTWKVTSEEKVTTCSMSVGKGERGEARVPVERGTSTFVCNCYCKN